MNLPQRPSQMNVFAGLATSPTTRRPSQMDKANNDLGAFNLTEVKTVSRKDSRMNANLSPLDRGGSGRFAARKSVTDLSPSPQPGWMGGQ